MSAADAEPVANLAPHTQVYLNRMMVAAMIGVEPDTLSNYRLPPPDAITGRVRGWKATTIAQWQANRPGRGRRA